MGPLPLLPTLDSNTRLPLGFMYRDTAALPLPCAPLEKVKRREYCCDVVVDILGWTTQKGGKGGE